MVTIVEICEQKIEVCFELDLNSKSLWSKEQWRGEFKKKGVKVFGLLFFKKLIGVCVFQEIIDEAQINYFSIDQKYRRKGYGSCLMNHLIIHCMNINLKKLILEVSESNSIADKFYTSFKFINVGKRKNYYKDGSDAILKEKKLIK